MRTHTVHCITSDLSARVCVYFCNSARIGVQLLYLGGLLLVTSCDRQPASTIVAPAVSDDVVARVGDTVIHLTDFQTELNRRSRALPARYATAEQRRELLNEMIREKVLLERAKAAGYDRNPEVVRRFEQMLIAKYEEDHKTNVNNVAAATADEIEGYYREQQIEFATPEKVHIAMLQLKGSTNATPEKQAELRQRAEFLRGEALKLHASEPTFGDLARQHSDDLSTRYKGGDSGWIERGRNLSAWPTAVMDAMFSLEKRGEITSVVQANGHCYLLKLIERKPTAVRPLAEVRDLIAHRVSEQKKAEADRHFHEQQRAGLQVEINEAALARMQQSEPELVKTPTLPPRAPAR